MDVATALIPSEVGSEQTGLRVAMVNLWERAVSDVPPEADPTRLPPDVARAVAAIMVGTVGGEIVSRSALEGALAAMTRLEVASAVLDRVILVEHPHPKQVERARVWADRLVEAARPPAQRALAHWIAAVVAQRSGDVAAADAHLTAALEADGHFAPAVDWGAWYASDRGDAARAFELWNRLVAPDPEDLAVLRPFLHRAGRHPERNEPCWCGSGQKYKKCHPGETPPVPLTDRVDWLWRKAVAYVQRWTGLGRPDFVAALRARALDPFDDETVVAALGDPIVADAVLTEGGWLVRFLTERGSLLPTDEAHLAAAWAHIPRTVYEIDAIVPDGVLRLRDRGSGDWLEAATPPQVPTPARGELLCGRALPVGAGYRFVGAVFAVTPAEEETVTQLCTDADGLGLCAWLADRERRNR